MPDILDDPMHRETDLFGLAVRDLVLVLAEFEALEPGLGWAAQQRIEHGLANGLPWRDPTIEELRAFLPGHRLGASA